MSAPRIGGSDRIRTGITLIDNQVHLPLCYGSWLREPDLNRRLRFMRPADCHFPIPRQNWCMWEDSNLRCSPLWVAVLQTAAVAAGPHMPGGAQLSRTVIPRGSLRVQAGSPHRWRYAPGKKRNSVEWIES